MRIAIIVEGKTETAFKPHLIAYLQGLLAGMMPKLDFLSLDGRIPTGGKLRRVVANLLNDSMRPADAVIALTGVYTGSIPPEFSIALHDFEAWLLPYWEKIQRVAGGKRNPPNPFPEHVNHGKPPAFHLTEVFRTGSKSISYSKTRDAGRILKDEDLSVAIQACPELNAFVTTILDLCDPGRSPNNANYSRL